MQTELKKKIPVLIDCDPGCDDFYALIWSLIMHKQGYIDIKAITTLSGNVPAQSTFENAVRACQMVGINSIALGKAQEKKEDAQNSAAHIHGNDGIGGLSKILPPIKKVDHHDSVELIINTINKYPNQMEVLVVGPMTNLAKAEEMQPGILKKIKRIIAMGGAFFKHGNVSPVAEFNVWFDPESAQKVLDSKPNIVFIPLDVTETLLFGLDDLKPIVQHITNKQTKDFLWKLCEFTIGTNMGFRETHYKKGFFVHDASTIGFLLYPHLYQGTFMEVSIETKGEYTKGMTVVDVRNHPKSSTNAFVVLKADKAGFLEAMSEDFKKLEA